MANDDKIKIIIEHRNIILNFTGGGLIIIKKNPDPDDNASGVLILNELEAAEFRLLWDMGMAAIQNAYQGVTAPVLTIPFSSAGYNPFQQHIHTHDTDDDEDED